MKRHLVTLQRTCVETALVVLDLHDDVVVLKDGKLDPKVEERAEQLARTAPWSREAGPYQIVNLEEIKCD